MITLICQRSAFYRLAVLCEEGLSQYKSGKEEEELTGSAWRPQWAEMVEAGWLRKESFGTLSRPSHEYQLDIFDLIPFSIVNLKDHARAQVSTRMTGDEIYSNVLQHQLDTSQAPLSILAVVAVAVSQAWYISRALGQIYHAAFMDELDIMSYIVNLLSSPTPTYFRGPQRLSSGRTACSGSGTCWKCATTTRLTSAKFASGLLSTW